MLRPKGLRLHAQPYPQDTANPSRCQPTISHSIEGTTHTTQTNPGSYRALPGTHGGGLWRPLDCSDGSDGADDESPAWEKGE